MMDKALNNSGRNSMIVGGLSALISFMLSMILNNKDTLHSIGTALAIGLVVMVLFQSIYNYFFNKVKQEGYSYFFAFLRLLLGLLVLKFLI